MGRFKSFPIEEDEHLLSVRRYVERDALRGNLVSQAESWPWSSLAKRMLPSRTELLDDAPAALPANWLSLINRAETEAELARLRRSVVRGAPFGDVEW